MRGVVLGVALAVMLPAQSFALTSLCAETASTGLNWREGKWVNADYALDQYIVQDVTENPALSALCTPTEKTTNEWGSAYADRCFNLSVVGEEKLAFATTLCRVLYDQTGTVILVLCDQSRYTSIKFEPTGEFVLTGTYGVPDSERVDTDQRDSLVLSAGKCSVVAP